MSTRREQLEMSIRTLAKERIARSVAAVSIPRILDADLDLDLDADAELGMWLEPEHIPTYSRDEGMHLMVGMDRLVDGITGVYSGTGVIQ